MTRKDRNIRITREFELEHGRIPFNLHEVYAWAVNKKLWYAPIDLAEKKFVAEMADALREEYITTDDGDKVRYYYAVTHGRQGTLWGNLDTAPRTHIDLSLKQRRRQSLADCRQMKTDMDYVNQKRFTSSPIQLSFNFDADLAEEAAYKLMKAAKRKAA